MAVNQKLIVEVIDGRNLLPKDGHGTSSPYVTIDFQGQRKRTQTVIRDLNPTWNDVLEFEIKPNSVFGDDLELDVYHDKTYGPTRRNNHLGRVRLNKSQFVRKGEDALIYYPLEKKYLLSWIQGDIGLKIYYHQEEPTPPVPPEPPAVEEANAEQPPPKPAEGEKPVPNEVETPSHPPEGEVLPPPPQAAAETSEPQPADNSPAPIPAEKPPKTESPPPAESAVDPKPADQEAGDIVLETSTDKCDRASVQKVMAAASVSLEPASETKMATPPNIPIDRPVVSAATPTGYGLESHDSSVSIERFSFDLVEKMHYLFVRVVKARYLPTSGSPIVHIVVSGSCRVQSNPARKTVFFEWDQTFAFGRDAPEPSSILEVSVWDPTATAADTGDNKFLGAVCFDVIEIPLRDPPDSPLAPQWYRLEGGRAHGGDLMLATWIGTQADDAFPDAWKTDAAGNVNSKAKVYLSPKLWYLRATVLEAQDVLPLTPSKEATLQIRAQLGFQVQKTNAIVTRNGSPSWNEDLLFVASEPFSDYLTFTLENRHPKGAVTIGVARIALTSIERRVDDRKVAARWFGFEGPNMENTVYRGRVQLRLCLDGGYHVMDEAAHVCSDYRPTAKQLWKQPIGSVELGIIRCKNLLPMKTVDGKGCTDAYCVAKYGPKWVRTRTICNSLDPKWNEQYTWKVYDPCTVLTIGVFDSSAMIELDGDKMANVHPDLRMGKVRIRISTLGTGKVYRNFYPLTLLTSKGAKKMGEIEIAVRFMGASAMLDLLHVYSRPLLPLMHHVKPLGVVQQELLRNAASKIISLNLSRSEPPLPRQTVLYMLDVDSHGFSMRKVRANWLRIINVIAGLIDMVRWADDTRFWKNPTATILVHALLVMLVWFPDLIVPTFAFYMFVLGAWNYRFRSRDPLPYFDSTISLDDVVDREELDEEFDTVPSYRPSDVIRARYDKLRAIGARVQTVLGDFATQGERVQALVTWRDPRATGIFVGLCFVVALVLYLVPSKMVAMAYGFYFFRHPIFRDRKPSPALNFFRRLPSLSDRIM